MKTKYVIGVAAMLGVVSILFLLGRGNQPDDHKLIPIKEITHGHGLAVAVNDQSKLYIATHHGLLVLIDEKDLYRVGESRDDYMGFSTHASDPTIFFSSGHPSYGGNIGFQKSEDGGFTWKKISDGLNGPVDFHAMAVSSVNPDLIFGWFRGDIQRSTDGGTSWEKFPTQFPIIALAADTKNEDVLYAASPLGLYKSINRGEAWHSLFDGFVASVAVHPATQTVFSFSEKFRLAKSVDGGKTWENINQRFDGETPLFISFYRQDPEIVYLMTEKNSIYKSTDGGDSWNKIR